MAQLSGLQSAKFCMIGLILFVPILLSWWLLRKLHRLFGYLPLGLFISVLCGVFAWLFAGPYSYSRPLTGALTGIASFALFLAHAITRTRQGQKKKEYRQFHGEELPTEMEVWEVTMPFTHPHPIHLVWFAFQYLLGLILIIPFYWHFIFFMTFADLFVLFGFRYLTQLDEFIIKNRKTASLPVRTMEKIHRILLAIGVLFLLLFALPALFYGKEPLAGLSTLELSWTPSDEDPVAVEYPVSGYDTMFPDEMFEDVEPVVLPEWVGFASNLFLYTILAVVLIGFIYGIYQAIRLAGKNFSVENEDEVIFLDSKEDARRFLRKKGSPRESRLSPNMQIRRRYKRTIRKSTEGRPCAWASPSELESHAGLAESADMHKLHDYYEKARYSKEGCTRADVDALQK
jgi:hypothetical protein